MFPWNPKRWSKTTWVVMGFIAAAVLYRIVHVDFMQVGHKIWSAAADPRWDAAQWALVAAMLTAYDKWATVQKIQENGLKRLENPRSDAPYYWASAAVVIAITFIFGLTAIQGMGRIGSAAWSLYHNPTLMAAWELISMATMTCVVIALQGIAFMYFFKWLPAWVKKVNHMEAHDPASVKRWITLASGLVAVFAALNGFVTFLL